MEECGGLWNGAGRCAKDLNCLRTCGCFTNVHTQNGVERKDCIFPFKFKGKIYASCTKDHFASGKAWCATEVDSTGTVVDGKWGECDSRCNDPTGGCLGFYQKEGRCIKRHIVEPQLQVQAVRYQIDENYGYKNNATKKCLQPRPELELLVSSPQQDFITKPLPFLPQIPPMITPEPGLVGVPGLPSPIHPDQDSEEEGPIQIIEENGNKVTCFYRNTQMVCNYPPQPGFPDHSSPGQGIPPPGLPPGLPPGYLPGYPPEFLEKPLPEPELPGPYPIPGQGIPPPGFPEEPFPEPEIPSPYPIPGQPIPGQPIPPSEILPTSPPEVSNSDDSVTITQNGAGTFVYCSRRNIQIICNNYQAPNHFDSDKALMTRGSQRFALGSIIASIVGSQAVKEGMKFIVANYPALKEIAADVYHHGKEAYNWLRGKKHETEVKTEVMDCTKTYEAKGGHDCSFAFDYNAAARHHGYAHCTLKPHACKAVKEIGENPPSTSRPSYPEPRPDVVPETPVNPGSGDNNMICNYRTKSGRNVIMACNYYDNYGKK